MDDKTIATLNELIQTCRDGQEGFKLAAEHIKNPTVRSLFEEFAGERGRLARDLQHEVSRLGGSPDTSGSISAALHRGWMDLRAALTNGDDQIVAEAERGEDVATRTFKSALDEVGDPQVNAAIRRAYEHVVAAHDRVRQLEKAGSRS